MIDPLEAIRSAWEGVIDERYAAGVAGDRDRDGAQDEWVFAPELKRNHWQLLARELFPLTPDEERYIAVQGRRGRRCRRRPSFVEPMLVWASEGTLSNPDTPDGRGGLVTESYRLDFRAPDARELAEAFRRRLEGALSWDYAPDDLAFELVVANRALDQFTARRVAVVLFRYR